MVPVQRPTTDVLSVVLMGIYTVFGFWFSKRLYGRLRCLTD